MKNQKTKTPKQTATTNTIPVQFIEIESAAGALARERATLERYVTDLNTELDAVKARHLGSIKQLTAAVAEAHEKLRDLLNKNPKLFEDPRTRVFHGLKVGFRKQPGCMTFDDPEKVIARIKREFDTNQDLYIHTQEAPNKETLQTLPASMLKKLGVTVSADEDKIVIAKQSTEIDNIIAFILEADPSKEKDTGTAKAA